MAADTQRLLAAAGRQLVTIDERMREATFAIDALATLAEHEGIRTAYMTERKNLPVVQILRQDLESFATLAFLFPLLFLTMASLTIYVLLNRLVESQRIQIGLMRAMGYSQRTVMLHYLGFAIMVGSVGSLTGVVAGH